MFPCSSERAILDNQVSFYAFKPEGVRTRSTHYWSTAIVPQDLIILDVCVFVPCNLVAMPELIHVGMSVEAREKSKENLCKLHDGLSRPM